MIIFYRNNKEFCQASCSFEETSKFLNVSWKPSQPPSFLNKICGYRFSKPVGLFFFLVNVRKGSDQLNCGFCAVDVAAETSTWDEGPTCLFWTCDFDWDMVSSTGGSVSTLSSSILEIRLPLIRTVRVEFSSCLKDMSKPFLMIKIAGTVFVFVFGLKKWV